MGVVNPSGQWSVVRNQGLGAKKWGSSLTVSYTHLSRGLAVISGLEMFAHQGARQFEIWTGKPAPEAEMMRVVELELRRRG